MNRHSLLAFVYAVIPLSIPLPYSSPAAVTEFPAGADPLTPSHSVPFQMKPFSTLCPELRVRLLQASWRLTPAQRGLLHEALGIKDWEPTSMPHHHHPQQAGYSKTHEFVTSSSSFFSWADKKPSGCLELKLPL